MSVRPYDPSTVAIHSRCHSLFGCITKEQGKRYCIRCEHHNRPDCTLEQISKSNGDMPVAIKFERTFLCTPLCLVQEGEAGTKRQRNKIAVLRRWWTKRRKEKRAAVSS